VPLRRVLLGRSGPRPRRVRPEPPHRRLHQLPRLRRDVRVAVHDARHGRDRQPGLRREGDEFSVIQRGPLENLFFIPAGLNTSNPAELLANGLIKSLLSRLGPLFDWIIIDSPPAVPVSDAALISSECDGVLLVVRSNGTPVDAACRARGEFADRNVVGVVLNGITPELSPYMDYYYSAYGSDAKAESKN